MSQDEPSEETDGPGPPSDGEAEREWSNRHWRRIKRLLGATAATFVLLIVAIAVENPPESGSTFETAPLSATLAAVFLLLLFTTPWSLSYLISKDKAALKPYFEGVTERPWYVVFVLNALTLGLYSPWYLYVRWRRLPDRRLPDPTGPGDGGSAAAGAGDSSEILDGIDDAVAVAGDAVRSVSETLGDRGATGGSSSGEATGDSAAAEDVADGEVLASNATGTVSERRLTRKRRFLNLWLFDDPPVAYLEPDEKPEFLLRHTNKGLKVTDPDGSSRRLDTRLSAGEKYLLVTDRRLVYLGGTLLSDDTVRSFRYEDLASVEADAGFTGGTLTFEDRDGVSYAFPTAMLLGSGLSLQSGELRLAGEYVADRIRDARTDEVETAGEVAAAPATAGGSTGPEDVDGEGAAARAGEDDDDPDAGVDTGDDEEGEERESRERAVRAAIRPLESTLDAAEALLADGDFEAARAELRGLDDEIEAADDLAAADGFEELRDELAVLEDRLARYRDRLDEREGERDRDRDGPGPPDRIPRAPDVTVAYDELTDEEPIGGGGNADVRRATVPTADGGVTVAIKTPRLSGTLHTDAIERMLDEAETWDRLDDHDHVVGVVDYGAEPIPWIAMEYMDAGHLGDRAGDLGLDQALWTALGVTNAVRHAHRRGVAHLDLKPENVLFLDVDGAWAVPKVADWGLSKHLLDHSKSVEGLSPTYAAPEQFDESYGPTDDITDVYQLGAVCYELFTGRPPFEGASAEVMRKVLDEEPAPPSEIADVPSELDDVLLRTLAKSREDRYDSLVYVRDELQALYEG